MGRVASVVWAFVLPKPMAPPVGSENLFMKYTMTPMRMSIGSMLVSKETQVGVVETSATYLTSGWEAMSSASESVPR